MSIFENHLRHRNAKR